MILIGVCGDRYMFADKDAQHNSECVVYNETIDKYVSTIRIGSWTARIFPWEEPTQEQMEKSKGIWERYERTKNDEKR